VDERNRYKNMKKTPNVEESLQPNSTTFDSQQAIDTEYKICTRDRVSVVFIRCGHTLCVNCANIIIKDHIIYAAFANSQFLCTKTVFLKMF